MPPFSYPRILNPELYVRTPFTGLALSFRFVGILLVPVVAGNLGSLPGRRTSAALFFRGNDVRPGIAIAQRRDCPGLSALAHGLRRHDRAIHRHAVFGLEHGVVVRPG